MEDQLIPISRGGHHLGQLGLDIPSSRLDCFIIRVHHDKDVLVLETINCPKEVLQEG